MGNTHALRFEFVHLAILVSNPFTKRPFFLSIMIVELLCDVVSLGSISNLWSQLLDQGLHMYNAALHFLANMHASLLDIL